MFSAKCRECKIKKRDGYGKSRNGHEKVMDTYFCQVCGNLSYCGMGSVVGLNAVTRVCRVRGMGPVTGPHGPVYILVLIL